MATDREGAHVGRAPNATAVYVLYGTNRLDLDWLPDGVPVICVHNDRRLAPEAIVRPGVEHVFCEDNIGFGAAANRAMSKVCTDRVVFLNPDTELTVKHWEALVCAGEDQIVTIPLVEPDGTPTIVSSSYPTPLGLVLAAYRLGRFVPRSGLRGRLLRNPAGARPLSEAWASGAVLSIAVSRFNAIGGFDERFFLYYEDVDMCARLAAGFPTMTVEVAPVRAAIHGVGGAAVNAVDRELVVQERASSAHRYAADRTHADAPPHRWMWWVAALAARPRANRAKVDRAARDARVVIVRLGRRSSMGEARRVSTWERLAEEAGLTVTQVDLLATCRSWIPRPTQLWRVFLGLAVPETLLWSQHKLRRRLDSGHVMAVVCITSRAFFDDRPARRTVILDYVDRLSSSYEARGAIAERLQARMAYRLLGAAHARVERRFRPSASRRVAAGFEDATALLADYVPVLVEPAAATAGAKDVDVLFLGTLDYPPNQAAVRELARQWPSIQASRPGTSALIAGARPTPEVIDLVARFGWELEPNFREASAVYARARVAVAPLRHCAGIQTKVIDAASHGVPQVVFEQALAGLPPGFPAVVADEETFASCVVGLLRSEVQREDQGEAARRWVTAHLAPHVWVHWLLGAVNDRRDGGPTPAAPPGRRDLQQSTLSQPWPRS